MPRALEERVLLIGDRDRAVAGAIAEASPGVRVHHVATIFDGIAELQSGAFSAVLTPVEPIERRPESAVRLLRDMAGAAQLVLYGHPTLEPLSRKMLEFGCDDYFVTPATPDELRQVFGQPQLRIVDAESTEPPAHPSDILPPTSLAQRLAQLTGLPLAELVLDALLQQPQNALNAVLSQINARLGPTFRLTHEISGSTQTDVPDGMTRLSHPMRSDAMPAGTLHLMLPKDEDEASARHALAQLALVLGRCVSLDDRHRRLQKLAITDDLTGVYNARWFRHFLDRILEKAKQKRFPVTLLLFDIDNFKRYNDQFGHGVGDEILRQTASLMKRTCRDHDLVARISGDEFAVVFWDNEPPRVPRDPASGAPARIPQTPLQIAERFRRLLQSDEFTALGAKGQGTLTISGGLAVYPYDAQTAQDLIAAADRALMFGAKRGGKNSIFLVGDSPEL